MRPVRLTLALAVAASLCGCSNDWDAFGIYASDAAVSDVVSDGPEDVHGDNVLVEADVTEDADAAADAGDAGEDADASNDASEDVADAPEETDAPEDAPADTPADTPTDTGEDSSDGSVSQTGVLIPLYVYPTVGDAWSRVAQAKSEHPAVPVVAIVNPNSGPGASLDVNYANSIAMLHAANVTTVGYVSTNWAARAAADVRADIHQYSVLYPDVDGIFLDEMAVAPGDESYYADLTSYAKDDESCTLVIGNPGTDTLSTYVGTVDSLVIYEQDGVPSLSLLGGWHTSFEPSNFGFLAVNVQTLDTVFVAQAAPSVGYMYITDDKGGNPWDSLPPYFEDLVAALEP